MSLLRKLEEATGPSRELDGEIAVAIFETISTDDDLIYTRKVRSYDHCTPGTYWYKTRSGDSLRTAPHYTASIDAALTLVPEGWGWSVGDVHGLETYLDTGRPWAEIWIRGDKHIHLPGMLWDGFGRNGINAETPALALCIAALKARGIE